MKPKGRPRKNPTNELLEAVRFVAPICKETGAPFETHCIFANQTLTAFNGIVGAGISCGEEILAAPHALRLLEAMEQCTGVHSLVLLDNLRIVLKEGKAKYHVPCIPMDGLTIIQPDPNIAVIDDRVKIALEIAGELAVEGAQKFFLAGVLLRANTAVSTDQKIAFECFHGIDLPSIVIPKQTIKILSKIKKKMSGFGYSGPSATFWFEDGSWIKTQLYQNDYPDVMRILSKKLETVPINPDLIDGLKAVKSYSDTGNVFFFQNKIQSHNVANVGASYDVAGLPPAYIFNIERLELVLKYAKEIDLKTDSDKLNFYGENMRGILMGQKG